MESNVDEGARRKPVGFRNLGVLTLLPRLSVKEVRFFCPYSQCPQRHKNHSALFFWVHETLLWSTKQDPVSKWHGVSYLQGFLDSVL